MSSLEELMAKAKDLHSDGHTVDQIADELSLSTDTITWLLTQGKAGSAAPKDVHIDWTVVSSSTTLLGGMASMLMANFESRCHSNDDDCDCEGLDAVIGVSVSGVPLATLMATEDGLDLAIYHPSKHNPEGKTGSVSGNFAKITGRRCLIVDDCITTGNTLTEIVDYLRRHKAEPVGICVIFDKRGIKEIEGVPVYSLFTIKRID
ncbi:MAG: orotate phosphoribosyltransferase-like protein [Methanocorpusculum sp.]|nr:orotate phosphoribosyltransferase-like protein [Methanocorpusculum sp.]